MTSKRLLITVLALGIVLPATTVRAAPLPERPPPTGFASVNGPISGRTLAGIFTGNARSAAAVLGGILGTLRGYFDGQAYSFAQMTDDLKVIWQQLHKDTIAASYPTTYLSSTQRGRELDQTGSTAPPTPLTSVSSRCCIAASSHVDAAEE